MSEDFWVDVPGMKESGEGWKRKGSDIANVASRIQGMIGVSYAEVVGTDKDGKEVWQQYEQDAANLQRAVQSLAKVVTDTGAAVVKSAEVFEATEKNNVEWAKGLGKNIGSTTDPNVKIDTSGGGSNTTTSTGSANTGGKGNTSHGRR